MTKKRTGGLGADPFDAIVAPTKRAAVETEPTAPRARKGKATYVLPQDVIDETRDAAVALSGPPHRLTLAGLVESALRRELERLRKAHNSGRPFPKHGAPLVGGRPIGS